jgi:hypothetical protein
MKFSSEKLFWVQSKRFWHFQNEIEFPKDQLGYEKFTSETSEISINVWEIQFHFGNAKMFVHGSEVEL